MRWTTIQADAVQRTELEKTDRRVALDLLDEGDFPGEVVACVLLEARLMVIGLVPDVIARRRGALAAGFPGARPGGVAAIEHPHLRLRPERCDFGRREMREHAILRGEDQHPRLAADPGVRFGEP